MTFSDSRLNRAAEHWSSMARQPKQPTRIRWWEHPKVLAHINQKVCGEKVEGHSTGLLKKFRTLLGPNRRLAKGVSIGCGTGAKEMRLISDGFVDFFDLYEISEERIRQGQALAQEKGIATKIQFHQVDAFQLDVDSTYDLVYWDNALHHMFDVRAAVRWGHRALKPGGFFVMDDFVGPSRFQWTDFNLKIVNQIRAKLPPHLMVSPYDRARKLAGVGRPSIDEMMRIDPSEAADSSQILDAVKQYFPDAEITLTGGCIYHLGLNDALSNFDDTNDADQKLLDELLQLDEQCTQSGETHYAVAFAQKTTQISTQSAHDNTGVINALQPLVSCVVIAYNYEKYVRNAVDSVLAQTGFQPGDIEIIVVDDGSTDSTPRILASYGDRIRVIHQKNQGPTIAMAAGIAAARGGYIAFLDADDEWTPERLRITVDHLATHPQVGLVHSDMSIMDGAGNQLRATSLALPANQPQTGRILGALLIGNQVTRSAITVRADLARAASQAPAWAWCSDWWLAVQIAVQHDITVMPVPLVRYRSHGENYNGLINRSAEKTRRLEERDVRVRRLLLCSVDLSAVIPQQLAQALSTQLQTMRHLMRAGVDVKALLSVTATDLAEAEALLSSASRLADTQPVEAVRLTARAIAIDPFNTTAQQFFDRLYSALNAPGTPQAAAPVEASPPVQVQPVVATDTKQLWQQAAAQQLAAVCPALLALPDLHALNPLQAWTVWQRLCALSVAPRVLELGFGPWAAPLAVMAQALGGSFYSVGVDQALAEALVAQLRHSNAVQRITVSLTKRVDTELHGEPGQFLDLSVLGDEANFDLAWFSAAQVLTNLAHATHSLPATAERLASQSSFLLETNDPVLQQLAVSRWAALDDSLQLLPESCHGTGLLVTIGGEQSPVVPEKRKRFVHFFYNNMHTQKVLSLFGQGGLDQDFTQEVFVERTRTIPGYDNDLSVCPNASFFSEQTDLPHIIESILAPDVEGVFMHGLFFGWQHQLVRAVGQHKKVIWFMWGGDLYNPIRQKQPFYETVKYVHAVATGVAGDYELFCKVYGHKPWVQVSYPTDIDFMSVNTPARKSKTIFVGNSGDPSNLHLEILEHLARKQDIADYDIVLPVTYNLHDPYKQQILACADKLGLAKHVRLLTQHMSPAEYYALVAEAEIFVTAHQRQQAYGNMLAALYFGTKMVLRKEISILNDGSSSINSNWEFLEQTLHARPISYTDFVSCSRLSDLPALSQAQQEAQCKVILDYYDHASLTAMWCRQFEIVAGI